MLVLSATFTAKDDSINELLQLADMLMPLSRDEPGCLRYDFLQAPHTPNRFVFFELWESESALLEHFSMPYFKILQEALPSLIEGDAEILVYETSGGKSMF